MGELMLGIWGIANSTGIIEHKGLTQRTSYRKK